MPFFTNTRRFAFFLATDRSGHSVLAQLLNAHRDVLFADEMDVFRLVERGFSREQIFALIWFQDERFARRGRKKSGYSYAVPGSWQDAEKHPLVVGDKKGMRTAWRLDADPALLERARRTIDLPFRVTVHLRHPLDSIATQARWDKVGLPEAVDNYLARIRAVSHAVSLLDADEYILQTHEDVIADPRRMIARMCDHLEVVADEPFLDQVEAHVFQRPRATRNAAPFGPADLDRLRAGLADLPLVGSRYSV